MSKHRLTPEQLKTFMGRIAPPDERGCTLWAGGMHPNGYGQITIGSICSRAHRLAWEVAHGPIPAGLFVLHRCDVALCVNPEHLFLGTHAMNMQDMVSKGRAAQGDRHGSKTHPECLRRGKRADTSAWRRGEGQHTARLTIKKVRQIRQLRETGLTLTELSVKFSVCIATIHQVTSRKTWAHA